VVSYDGAPVHYGDDDQQWLNVTYPGRLNGHSEPTTWLHQSPDLILMYFFLWRNLNKHIYAIPPGLSKISCQDFKQL
jgi:hypothetical protein